MIESGKQTDKLISVYRQQLEQLTKEANDTHELAVSTKVQADATKNGMYLEQRPWVGIEVHNIPPLSTGFPPKGLQPSRVSIVAHNTGKTPALRWRYLCCEADARKSERQLIPSYDVLKANIDRHINAQVRASASPQELAKLKRDVRESQAKMDALVFSGQSEVIPPNGTRELEIENLSVDDGYFHFFVGKVVYFDGLNPTQKNMSPASVWSPLGLELCACAKAANS